MLIIYTTVRL